MSQDFTSATLVRSFTHPTFEFPTSVARAAVSHGIGSDSQRPFAIVIVGGLISGLVLSIFLLPTLYTWLARTGDQLPAAETEEAV